MTKQEKEKKGDFETYGFKGVWIVNYFIKLDDKTLGLLCSNLVINSAPSHS